MAKTNILLESGTNELEIVEFLITEELPDGGSYTGHYGVNVAKVLEIIRLPEVTKMSDSDQACVLGAFNLRSRVIPLIDLGAWLGKTTLPSENNKVIVTEFNNVTNSFLVSGVQSIHRLSWEQVEPPGDHVVGFSQGSITGVVKLEDRIIFLLDMEMVVADLNPKLGIQESTVAEESDAANHAACKILFADDSSMIRKTLSSGLQRAGFEVTLANDGKQAWEQMLSYKQEAEAKGKPVTDFVNILISDIEMPVMDGHNLTKRVKEDPVLGILPVILFSSLITDALKHKGEAVGADDQITKPNIATLVDRTRALLTQKQGIVFDEPPAS